jgi:hypothetical protein
MVPRLLRSIVMVATCVGLGAREAWSQVTAHLSLTANSFSVYEPIFVSTGVQNGGTLDITAGLGPACLAVERKDGGGAWQAVDLFEGVNCPESEQGAANEGRVPIAVGANGWRECLIRRPEVYAQPGDYRVRLQAPVVDANGVASRQDSAWSAFTVVADQKTSDLIEANGLQPAYTALFFLDYGVADFGAVGFDEAALVDVVAGNAAPGVVQFVDLLRAKARLRESAVQTTAVAVQQKLDAAIALIDSMDLGMYGGDTGGVAAHAYYTRACAGWIKASTLAQFDASTLDYQAIDATYAAAHRAVYRPDMLLLRNLLP